MVKKTIDPIFTKEDRRNFQETKGLFHFTLLLLKTGYNWQILVSCCTCITMKALVSLGDTLTMKAPSGYAILTIGVFIFYEYLATPMVQNHGYTFDIPDIYNTPDLFLSCRELPDVRS